MITSIDLQYNSIPVNLKCFQAPSVFYFSDNSLISYHSSCSCLVFPPEVVIVIQVELLMTPAVCIHDPFWIINFSF